MFTRMKLCLATVTHDFKRVEIIHICSICKRSCLKTHFAPYNSDLPC